MKPAINLCSAFRQGSSYARSFFHQVKALTELGYELKSITIVLDGETLTDTSLIEAQTDPRVRFVFEGPHPAPTCFMDERSITWARAANLALEASLSTPSEFTLWVESDLTFPCDLIELLMEPNQDIVAPIVMLGQIFYDSWGFRDLSGQRIFTLAKLQALPQGPGPLTELSSVGSCLLFRSSLLTQGVRLPSGYENGLLVGFCLAARSRGARVFCRHDVAIAHPTSLWASQVYRVTFCRLGNEKVWRELAPRAGNILAGPYFDFVIPEALETLRSNHSPVAAGRSITFATNIRREIAVLIGEGESRPTLPDGFGVIAPPQPMRVPASLEGALKEDPVKTSPEELASKSNARREIEGLKEELAKQRKAQQEAVEKSVGGLKEELAQQRKAQQEAVEKSVGGLKEELAQKRKAQQEAVERSVGEVKKEIVAEIQSLIANLVEQGEKNRLEVSARIDSVEGHMVGRIVEVAEYATKIQEAVVSPSSYLIPAPFSWYSYLYKMLNIRKLSWVNKEKQSALESKRAGFWRRLERSIRKRRKILAAAWNFDPVWYLEAYPEVSKAGAEPLSHYINFGKQEGRHKNKSCEGIGTGLIRMLKTLRKDSLTTAPRIILQKVESVFWVVTLKQTGRPLEGLLKISARNRYDELQFGEEFNNKKDHKILVKLPLGIQKIAISFEDKFKIQKTVVTKITKVSNAKKSQPEKLVTQNYDGFVDLSKKRARASVWRQLETRFRNNRGKILPKLLIRTRQPGLSESGDFSAVALTLNRQADKIFKEISRSDR